MFAGFTLLLLLGAAGAGAVVRIDDLWKEARPALVVVDLDEDADREATERFVRGFRDQLLAGAEILDLRAPPADAAKRMRAGFVFFGTAGGRTGAAILRGTFGAARLGTDAIALPALGLRSKGRDLRLMFVGRNPVPGGQPVIAYLAPNGRAGPRGAREAHAGRGVERLAGHGPVPVRALARTLYRAAAQVGDGHTRLNWRRPLTAINAGESRYPPLVLAYQNGEYRVREAAGSRPGLVGQTVAAIEGQPTDVFLSGLLALCAGETAASRASTFEQQQPLFWYLSGLLDGRARLRFAVDDRAGVRHEVEAPLLPFAEFSGLAEASTPSRSRTPRYRFIGTSATSTTPASRSPPSTRRSSSPCSSSSNSGAARP